MKPIAQLINDFHKVVVTYEKNMQSLPQIIGKIAVDVAHENFKAEGYIANEAVNKWKKRSPQTNKNYDRKGSVYSSKNPLLRQTNKLYNSINYNVKSKNTVFIGVNLSLIPYAQIHNEGLEGKAWGKNPFTMPKRKFIGINQKLKNRIKAKIKIKNKMAFKFISR